MVKTLIQEFNKNHLRGKNLLYHVTYSNTIINILQDGVLKPNFNRGSNFYTKNSRPATISLSRDKSFNHGISINHKLIFDGDLIKRDFKLLPYNDYPQISKSNPTQNGRKENEEVIVTNKPFPIVNYLIGITNNAYSQQRYWYNMWDNEGDKERFLFIYDYCKSMNIPYFNTRGEDMTQLDLSKKSLNESMDLNALKLQPNLNPKFWNEHGSLEPKVEHAIKVVSKDFYDTLKINVPLLDVIFTGSLANYNWSKYSDVDVHLVIDYNLLYDTLDPNKEYDKEEFLKEYFDDKKMIWNDTHTMKIFGHDVEVYVQNIHDKLDATGIYSIQRGEWLSTPSHIDFKPNFKLIRSKASQYMRMIDDIEKKQDVKGLTKLQDKLKAMRQRGLDTDGELSVQNLIYKILRREGYIEKLWDLKNEIFDRKNTLK